jgi:hypothetical protein
VHAGTPTALRALPRFRVDVADAASADRYSALVGGDAVSRSGGNARISIGLSIIELVGPDDGDTRSRLRSRGKGVSSVVMRGAASADLYRGRSHGAVLRIVSAGSFVE